MSRLGARLTAAFFPAVGDLLAAERFGRRDGGILMVMVQLGLQTEVFSLFFFYLRLCFIALMALLCYLV